MIHLTHRDTELTVDIDGHVRVDGDVLRLDAPTMRRLRMAVDPDHLRGLGTKVGVGDQASTLTAFDVTVAIRHRGDFASVARSVLEPLATLLDLADVVRGRGSLASWTARLPIAIETEGLVVRFNTYEPRVHDSSDRDRWTSIFADGKCLRFDAASLDVRGRFAGTTTASRDTVANIASLVAQLTCPRSVDGTFEHDEDRNIALIVQRPDAKTSELLTSRWSWSFWVGAERACQERIQSAYAPGEHALVYALYELLVPLR